MNAVINVVLPVFAIVAVGYGAGRMKILGSEASPALSGYVFYIALPVLLFIAMTRVSPAAFFNPGFILTYGTALFVGLLFSMLITRILFPTRRLSELALNGMSAIYGNTGYMGIPLVLIAFGNEALIPAVIATVINTAVIFGVVTSIIEADLSTGDGPLAVAKDVTIGLTKNPLFIAPVMGVLVSYLGISLPVAVISFCDILGASAGPCALFSLGLFLVGKRIHKDRLEISIIVLTKLIILPLVTFVALQFIELEPMWAAVAMIMAALPTGTGAFVVAQRYNTHADQISAITLISTLISVVSLSVLFSVYG